MTQPELETRLQVLMGGYAAERIVLGDVSTGSESDLKEATQLATNMVSHYGMSDELGAVYFSHHEEQPFLGQRIAMDGGTSDATVHTIESNARALLTGALERAEELIGKRRQALDQLVAALMAHETLEQEELLDVLGPPAPRGTQRNEGVSVLQAAARISGTE
jgi:cell division protease FtsH